ncbi:hypothetical protein HYPSUDRAFT_207616 [Hypholoma sublateritium FD-334 SS-4]|uniref:Uncharacterized protein n=1 Tax=Hypholoma sublateritium (strain FD-334 SS-4) TaxID=945553 RepID=A0A0D2NGH7_HYPSF|nr:hypothetical protein HYPSUDRAFT_207616 [Hypholoma sublateritium FD-334 SS-4]
MNPNIDYTGVPYDFHAERYSAYTPAIAPQYYQACVQPCTRTVDYYSESVLPPSPPPLPWVEGLAPSAGPSDLPWLLPAFGHSGGTPRSESSHGLLTTPSAPYMGFNPPLSPPAPCINGWVPLESTYSAGPLNTPWPVPNHSIQHDVTVPWPLPAVRNPESSPQSESLGGISTLPTILYMGHNLLPTPPVSRDSEEGCVSPETTFSAGSSNATWPLPNLEQSWESDPTFPLPPVGSTPPSIPYMGYNRYNWPFVAQEYSEDPLLAVNVPGYPSPVSNGEDQYLSSVNVSGQITQSSNLFSEEGIEAKNNKSGLPTGSGQSSAGSNGVGNDIPHTLHVQRDATTEEGGPSLGKGKGKGKRKRMVEDSLENVPNEKQSPKRARHNPQLPERKMGDQPPKMTYSAGQGVEHKQSIKRRGPKKTAPAQPKALPFFEVTGITDSGGDAKMKKNKCLEMSEPPAHMPVGPPVSMYPNQRTVPATKEITLDGINMGVGCVPLNRKERAALERKAGIRKAVRKRTSSNKKQDQAPGAFNTVDAAFYADREGINRWRWTDGKKRESLRRATYAAPKKLIT